LPRALTGLIKKGDVGTGSVRGGELTNIIGEDDVVVSIGAEDYVICSGEAVKMNCLTNSTIPGAVTLEDREESVSSCEWEITDIKFYEAKSYEIAPTFEADPYTLSYLVSLRLATKSKFYAGEGVIVVYPDTLCVKEGALRFDNGAVASKINSDIITYLTINDAAKTQNARMWINVSDASRVFVDLGNDGHYDYVFSTSDEASKPIGEQKLDLTEAITSFLETNYAGATGATQIDFPINWKVDGSNPKVVIEKIRIPYNIRSN